MYNEDKLHTTLKHYAALKGLIPPPTLPTPAPSCTLYNKAGSTPVITSQTGAGVHLIRWEGGRDRLGTALSANT